MKSSAALSFFAFFGSAAAVCPNACNGHGSCGRFDRCDCYAGFTGGDCAGKTCAYSVAWSDTAAHSYAECGNRGECNRESGLCECNEGYEGKGCKRLSCAEGCSGHGTCETMAEVNGGYTGWDKDKIMTCKCDPGYEGSDCASRMCIPGDDPMSVKTDAGADQVNQVSLLTITGSGAITAGDFTLKVTDWRGETWETWPIALSAVVPTGIEVKEALEALPNHAVPEVTVTVSDGAGNPASTTTRVWSITFKDARNSGDVTLEANTVGCTTQGCQPVVTGIAGSHTAVVTKFTAATTESLVCSARGDCDSEMGLCKCYDGYTGEACEMQTIII